VAQLVAHLHGMQGVRGSSPLSSTLEALRETRIWFVFHVRSHFFALKCVLLLGPDSIFCCADKLDGRVRLVTYYPGIVSWRDGV
jgi:hypothetical protein